MASATATHPAETKAPGPKHNIEAMREEYYRAHRQARHDAALEGDEQRRHQGAGDALRAGHLAL